MGLLTRTFRPRGPTHGSPPILLSESSWSGTHGSKPHQQPPSAWQVSFGLKNSNLPYYCEVVECFVLSRIIGRVLGNTNPLPPSQF
jgi:hypothetical protein